MDVTSFAGVYQSLKAAKELLAVAINAKVDAEAKSKISEAQTRLGEVQDTLFVLREKLAELQEESKTLKEQLANAEAWNAKLSQYELTRAVGGAVVLAFKAEPAHFACPSCVNKREVHILQTNRTISGKYRCTGCGSEYPIEQRQQIDPIKARNPW